MLTQQPTQQGILHCGAPSLPVRALLTRPLPSATSTSPPPPLQFWPGFLATFLSYDHPVSRSDALRPLLLHTLGGVYLDLDIECFAPLEPMLAGADVVLQVRRGCSVTEGRAAVSVKYTRHSRGPQQMSTPPPPPPK